MWYIAINVHCECLPCLWSLVDGALSRHHRSHRKSVELASNYIALKLGLLGIGNWKYMYWTNHAQHSASVKKISAKANGITELMMQKILFPTNKLMINLLNFAFTATAVQWTVLVERYMTCIIHQYHGEHDQHQIWDPRCHVKGTKPSYWSCKRRHRKKTLQVFHFSHCWTKWWLNAQRALIYPNNQICCVRILECNLQTEYWLLAASYV